MNYIRELSLIFEDWCLWNIKKLKAEEFNCRYEISPFQFRKEYWKKGLQKYWIKFQTK